MKASEASGEKKNSPEIEINKFIRLQSLFVLHPPLPLQTNTTTHEKNRGETRLDLCPLAKHSIYLALIAGLIWRGSYTQITPQDNSKTRQGLTKERQPKEKKKRNKEKCIWDLLDIRSRSFFFSSRTHTHTHTMLKCEWLIWAELKKQPFVRLVWKPPLQSPHH